MAETVTTKLTMDFGFLKITKNQRNQVWDTRNRTLKIIWHVRDRKL